MRDVLYFIFVFVVSYGERPSNLGVTEIARHWEARQIQIRPERQKCPIVLLD